MKPLLNRWVIKSESDADRVWMLVDHKNVELGANQPGQEHKFYRYESLDGPADPFIVPPKPPFKQTKFGKLVRSSRYGLSAFMGAGAAIVVLVIRHKF